MPPSQQRHIIFLLILVILLPSAVSGVGASQLIREDTTGGWVTIAAERLPGPANRVVGALTTPSTPALNQGNEFVAFYQRLKRMVLSLFPSMGSAPSCPLPPAPAPGTPPC
jgi:hypothetical protein